MSYPVISEAEFKQRQSNLKDKMKKEGYDLLILYANDGAVFGQEYTRWLFNYQPHFEPACVLMPVEGEAVLLTGYESQEYVYASSYCDNVNVVDEFIYGAHEFPFAEVVTLKQSIDQVQNKLGREFKKIGIAGSDKMSHTFYVQLEDILGKGALLPADSLVMDLRLIKTEDEIKVIEHAYHIAESGMKAAIEAIAVGKTERQIAAEAEYVMRSLGSEGMGIDTMVASGKKNSAPIIARTSFKEIQKNELVILTIAPRYEGYHAAIARPIIVGEVDEEIEVAINAAISAQEAAQELLKPGSEGYQVDEASRGVIEKAGLSKHFVYTGGHSIGVSEFEPPSLNKQFKETIKENMVFSVDIPLFFNSWGGFRYENGFHITKDGARPLQTLGNKLIRL